MGQLCHGHDGVENSPIVLHCLRGLIHLQTSLAELWHHDHRLVPVPLSDALHACQWLQTEAECMAAGA